MADDHQQDADEDARNRDALEAYDRAQNMRDRHAQFVERQQNLSGMAEQVSTQGSGQEQVSPQGRDQPGNPLSPLRLGGASQQPAAPQFATDTATRKSNTCYNIEDPNLPSIMTTTFVVRYHEG